MVQTTIHIATALKYTDAYKTMHRYVADDDKRQQRSVDLNPAYSGLKLIWKMMKYINESGLYCVFFGSVREETKLCKIGLHAQPSRK